MQGTLSIQGFIFTGNGLVGGSLFKVKYVVHWTLERELQGGAGDVAIMGSPPAVHATPQLWHHQRTVQAACYSHGRPHLPHTTTVLSATEEGVKRVCKKHVNVGQL